MGVKHIGAVDIVVKVGHCPGSAEKHERVFVDPAVANGGVRHVVDKIAGVFKNIPQENAVILCLITEHFQNGQ